MKFKDYINQDRVQQYPLLSKGRFLDWLFKPEMYYIRKFLRMLRSEEYYTNLKPCKLKMYCYRARKNRLGAKLGFEIPAGCFGPGLMIYHHGAIIVNPKSRIGANCTMHGICCIGSKGGFPDDSPVIGDNVDLGQASQILGGITIASNVRVGAGSIVTKDIPEEGAVVVGIPGRIKTK